MSFDKSKELAFSAENLIELRIVGFDILNSTPLASLQQVEVLSLEASKVDLKFIKGLKRLTELNLFGANYDPNIVIETVRSTTTLKRIYLDESVHAESLRSSIGALIRDRGGKIL